MMVIVEKFVTRAEIQKRVREHHCQIEPAGRTPIDYVVKHREEREDREQHREEKNRCPELIGRIPLNHPRGEHQHR